MVTCDLAKLDADGAPRAAYGCILNVKGKILGDAIVVAEQGRLGVFVSRPNSAAILELWTKYIIMEDCEVALDDTRTLLAFHGGAAQSIADAAGVSPHAAKLDELGVAGLVVDVARSDEDPIVARAIAAGAIEVDQATALALHVEAGRATFGVDLDEHNYVQEGGLQARAVSFQKGCYLGQEVVCMLQMRGKVHKRLMQLKLESPIEKGAEVKSGADVVGKVTSVAAHDGKVFALAMLKSSIAEGAAVDVGGACAQVVSEAS